LPISEVWLGLQPANSAITTGQKFGHAKMMTAPMPSTASAERSLPRLARVLSIAAPIGVSDGEPE
jgi:hypothetical protein